MNEQTITGRWNFDRSKSKREKSGRSTPLVKGKEEDQKKKKKIKKQEIVQQ